MSVTDFAAVLAQAALVEAVSDTASPADRADAQRLAAGLLGSCPATVNDIRFDALAAFLSDPGTDPDCASAAAWALARSKPSLRTAQLMAAFLSRPGLSLSDIVQAIAALPATATVLASESDRPDLLELVFADVDACDEAVAGALAINVATPPGLRAQAVSMLLNQHRKPLPVSSPALRALREHPETQIPVFDALTMPGVPLLKLFAYHPESWNGLAAEQLNRLVCVFERVVPADDRSLDWQDCSWQLLLHPGMPATASQRLVAAVDMACTPSAGSDVFDWSSDLAAAVEVLSAPNRAAALFERTFPRTPVRHRDPLLSFVLGSASAHDLLKVLTDPDIHGREPARRGLLINRIAQCVPARVCTPELLAMLPIVTFRKWREQGNDPDAVDAALADLLVSRLGSDITAWQIFTDLAEVADEAVTVGDVADLAANLTTRTE